MEAMDERVARHYGRPDLLEAIEAALAAAGKAEGPLTPDDLAPLDQFHTRGARATLELARRAGVGAATRVLDLGGGLGGSARLLAASFGCTVEVLDLTAAYCAAGRALTERSGLGDRVRFRHGSALAAPYADGSFDLVWTQHSTMNIADLGRLAAEAHRLLRPAGRLALHEILAGPAPGLHLPVPWASEAALSFLRRPEELRGQIAAAGFAELDWSDETEIARQWFEQRVAAMERAGAPPPLGLHLLLGPQTPLIFRNLLRNLQEGRVAVVQAVFERR